jgi:hypothetical protein
MSRKRCVTDPDIEREFGPFCPDESFEAGVHEAWIGTGLQYDTREWNEIVMYLYNRWQRRKEHGPQIVINTKEAK